MYIYFHQYMNKYFEQEVCLVFEPLVRSFKFKKLKSPEFHQDFNGICLQGPNGHVEASWSRQGSCNTAWYLEAWCNQIGRLVWFSCTNLIWFHVEIVKVTPKYFAIYHQPPVLVHVHAYSVDRHIGWPHPTPCLFAYGYTSITFGHCQLFRPTYFQKTWATRESARMEHNLFFLKRPTKLKKNMLIEW